MRDWLSFGLAAAAFAISIVVGFYSSWRRDDFLSVVIDDMPWFVGLSGSPPRMGMARKMGLVFINSGNRPIAVLGIKMFLMEGKEARPTEQQGTWDCSLENERDHRVLEVEFEPFVVKQDEVIRKSLTLAVDVKRYKQGANEEMHALLPMPSWYEQNTTDYWVNGCLSFRMATPSDSYASGSIDVAQSFGMLKNKNYFHSYFSQNTQPYKIWYSPGNIFSRR